MRVFLMATAAAFMTVGAPAAMAETPAAAAAAKAKYNSSETEIGVMLDDPAAKAIIEKHIPGMTTDEQIDMARGMTLKAVQQYSPDDVTDAQLAAIDADLAALK